MADVPIRVVIADDRAVVLISVASPVESMKATPVRSTTTAPVPATGSAASAPRGSHERDPNRRGGR
jgi:hypothetical protein